MVFFFLLLLFFLNCYIPVPVNFAFLIDEICRYFHFFQYSLMLRVVFVTKHMIGFLLIRKSNMLMFVIYLKSIYLRFVLFISLISIDLIVYLFS